MPRSRKKSKSRTRNKNENKKTSSTPGVFISTFLGGGSEEKQSRGRRATPVKDDDPKDEKVPSDAVVKYQELVLARTVVELALVNLALGEKPEEEGRRGRSSAAMAPAGRPADPAPGSGLSKLMSPVQDLGRSLLGFLIGSPQPGQAVQQEPQPGAGASSGAACSTPGRQRPPGHPAHPSAAAATPVVVRRSRAPVTMAVPEYSRPLLSPAQPDPARPPPASRSRRKKAKQQPSVDGAEGKQQQEPRPRPDSSLTENTGPSICRSEGGGSASEVGQGSHNIGVTEQEEELRGELARRLPEKLQAEDEDQDTSTGFVTARNSIFCVTDPSLVGVTEDVVLENTAEIDEKTSDSVRGEGAGAAGEAEVDRSDGLVCDASSGCDGEDGGMTIDGSRREVAVAAEAAGGPGNPDPESGPPQFPATALSLATDNQATTPPQVPAAAIPPPPPPPPPGFLTESLKKIDTPIVEEATSLEKSAGTPKKTKTGGLSRQEALAEQLAGLDDTFSQFLKSQLNITVGPRERESGSLAEATPTLGRRKKERRRREESESEKAEPQSAVVKPIAEPGFQSDSQSDTQPTDQHPSESEPGCLLVSQPTTQPGQVGCDKPEEVAAIVPESGSGAALGREAAASVRIRRVGSNAGRERPISQVDMCDTAQLLAAVQPPHLPATTKEKTPETVIDAVPITEDVDFTNNNVVNANGSENETFDPAPAEREALVVRVRTAGGDTEQRGPADRMGVSPSRQKEIRRQNLCKSDSGYSGHISAAEQEEEDSQTDCEDCETQPRPRRGELTVDQALSKYERIVEQKQPLVTAPSGGRGRQLSCSTEDLSDSEYEEDDGVPARESVKRGVKENKSYSSRRSSTDSSEDGINQNVRDLKQELKDLEEKFRKAMVANASLDNEKSQLMFQVDLLKDQVEEGEEQAALVVKELRAKSHDYEILKRDHAESVRAVQLLQQGLQEQQAMLQERGLVLLGTEEEGEEECEEVEQERRTRAIVSQETANILSGLGTGPLDVRIKRLAGQRDDLQDTVRRLKLDFEEERSRNSSARGTATAEEMERETKKLLDDYKFKISKSEQEIATLGANVARLESQVIRYKTASETSELSEENLKAERRKMQRELRDSQTRNEELETQNKHLEKRLDKLKTAKSNLLKEL